MFGFSIVPGPQMELPVDPDKHKYGLVTVLIMAIGIPVVGILSGWNMGAASGLWSLFVGTILVGLLYLCLISCYGELCGTVPFSGGSFGYCRCALGPFWGFIVGASEVLQYFSYGIVASTTASRALTASFQTSSDVEPVYVLIIYFVTFLVQLRGGNLLWNAVTLFSIISIFPVVLFLGGAFAKYDYNKFADMQPSMYKGIAGGEDFMTQALYSPTFFFIGIEMLPQVCNHIRNPNVTLPRGLFYGCLLALILSLLTVIAAAGIAPGYGLDLAFTIYPMDQILEEIYGIPAHINDVLFVVPGCLLCVFSMMYSSSHQMGALAKSALLPTVLGTTFGPFNVPYIALLLSSLLQFTVYCAIHFKYTKFDSYPILLISAMFVYVGVFAAYIVFSLRFHNMQRHWRSPFGVAGAVVGLCLNVVLIVSILGYRTKEMNDTKYITVYFVFVALCVLYYFVYAQHHQFFSPEEQQKFLKAYITNVNKRKKAAKSTFSVSGMVGDVMVVMFGRSNLFRGGSSHHSANSRDTANRSKQILVSKRVTPVVPESGDTAGANGHSEKRLPVLGPVSAPAIIELKPPDLAEATTASAGYSTLGTDSKKQQLRRVSWNVNNQGVFGMSDKAMSAKESQKFVEMVLGHGDESPEEMLAALANTFPEQFVLENHATA